MQIKHILPIAAAVLLVGCSGGGKKDANTKELSREEQIKNDTVSVNYDYHPNQKVWREKPIARQIINGDTTTWKLHGLYKEYYENGALSSQVNYVRGKKSGTETKYYLSGKVYHEANYVDGEQDGIKKRYYESGKVMSESPYKRGLLGLGVVEYNEQGAALPALKLKVWTKDNRSVDGTFTVNAQVLTASGSALKGEFFQGMLIEGKWSHPNLQPMPSKGTTATITYNSSNMPPMINVVVKAVTPRKTTVLLSQMVNM